MPELNHFFQVVSTALTHNVWVQGAFVSLLVALMRRFSTPLDEKAKDPNQVKIVQAIIAVLSIATQVLTAYVSGHMGDVDWKSMIGTVQVMLVALGFHQAGKDIKSNPTVHKVIEATKAKLNAPRL